MVLISIIIIINDENRFCKIMLWKLWYLFGFSELNFFCNIINVFTVTFDQINTSLLNKKYEFIFFFFFDT